MTIRTYMQRHGLTTRQFATLCDLSIHTVYRLKVGKFDPKATTIGKIVTGTKGEVTAQEILAEYSAIREQRAAG